MGPDLAGAQQRAARSAPDCSGCSPTTAREPDWAATAAQRGALRTPAALTALLPAEVDRIFLQNDLTAIAPGPLAPALDVRLRTMAARESAAQASSYRFTPESIAHAFVAGETEESILEFLGALSLTGIPQPLELPRDTDGAAARPGAGVDRRRDRADAHRRAPIST